MIKLVNKTKARNFAKEYAGDKIKLVASSFFDDLEEVVKAAIRAKVDQHPSGFKTLK